MPAEDRIRIQRATPTIDTEPMEEALDPTREPSESDVAANERLTSLTGALLLVLLALMGVTVLSVQDLLPEHFLLGFLLIPPLTLKLASTGYRFVRYYTGDPRYRHAGVPQPVLRLIAPIVVISTIVVFATGIELWWFGLRYGSIWIEAHRLSFIVWLPATAIHVLSHMNRSGRAVVEELSATPVAGASRRRAVVIGALVAGIVLAAASLTYASPFIFFGDGG